MRMITLHGFPFHTSDLPSHEWKFGSSKLGILDHVWKDPQASWKVYARVVPNGDGSTVMMTLFQPPIMTDIQFDQAMKEMDIEMAKLKEVLER
jgi:hypothetical protein